MAVYFKFKSAKDFDSVSIDGHFISVGTLKEKIVEQKKLGRGSDFNLVISNAQTEEEYTDDGFLVPKNTSVIVRRVPGRPSMPIVADVKDERKSAVAGPPVSNGFEKLESTQNITLSSTVDALDDFGVDLYADPVVVQAHSSLAEEEDSKIRAFVDATASDWQRQTQEGFSGGKGYGTKGQGRGLPLRGGYGGRGLEKRNPPHGYVCHRCGIPGHYIQHCPTNGDPQYDVKKVKPPTGIPKTMLVANPDGSYALPTGEVAVLKPNEAVFEKEVEGLPSSVRQILDVPPEFTCPLCKGVLKNAVLTSKCCFKSFCDDCIRNEIISKGQCVCGTKNILADDLLPNRTLREAIDRVLEAQVSGATSSGLVGSRAQLPDMESARHARSKLPSPGLSISLKEASSTMVASDGSDTTKPNAGENFTAETAGSPAAVTKAENASGVRPSNQAGASNAARDVKGVDDVAPESQLTDPVQDVVSSENQMKSDVQNRDQGLNVAEPAKGKKKLKVKRARTGDQGFKRDAADGMWDQGPNPNYMYNNPMMQPENFCVHCGSYQHPSWNCYMVNGPGPAHPPMHGPMFGPRFHPEMRGMMHPPMGDGYGMPYHPNAGPFNDYGVPPYDFHMNGPMMPMQEPFMPPAMMPYGPPPMQRDSIEPGPLSRDEFEAKKAELKRRREREQRFGREHVKYASSEFDMGPPRVHGNGAPRIPNVSERDRERDVSPDAHGHRQAPGRLDHTGERRQYVRVRPSKVKDDWTDNEEIQHSSDEGSAHGEYPAADSIERWSSRHADEGISGDMMRDIRFTRDGVGHYSSNYKHQANGDTAIPTSMRFGHKRSVSRYESDEEDDTRRQSGNQVGPSSPSRTALPRIAASDDRFPREIKNNSSDPNGSGGRRQAGEKVGKIIDLRERPRGSVFERTNLASKPRGAVDEDYAVIDEREFSRLKRAEAARNNRATENRTQGGRDTDEGTWQRTAVVSRKRRLVEAS